MAQMLFDSIRQSAQGSMDSAVLALLVVGLSILAGRLVFWLLE
ncbi:MAG TPA: hypothetical protein VFC10_07270 [Terriglobia bacterium]|jgi:hypothetical protein|nr:hypothetical protein [Terracidiphilus sp.]HZT69533.1 hypothetical protein [Terriglobia bacterium]